MLTNFIIYYITWVLLLRFSRLQVIIFFFTSFPFYVSYVFSGVLVHGDVINLNKLFEHQFQLQYFEDLNLFIQLWAQQHRFLWLVYAVPVQENRSMPLEFIYEIEAKKHQFLCLGLVQAVLVHEHHFIPHEFLQEHQFMGLGFDKAMQEHEHHFIPMELLYEKLQAHYNRSTEPQKLQVQF